MDLPEGLAKALTYTYNVNQAVAASYHQVFNYKKMTRNQVRIFAGIEMYYGNMDDLKFIYAAREIEPLGKYINALQRLKEFSQDAHDIVARYGMDAFTEHKKKLDAVQKEIKTLKDEVLTRTKELDAYGISIKDIEALAARF